MGVWIETIDATNDASRWTVTPFVGVWIETVNRNVTYEDNQVTPFVGVWIETRIKHRQIADRYSHTLRGCVD